MAMTKKARAAALKNLAKARAAKRSKKSNKKRAHATRTAPRRKSRRRGRRLKVSGRIRPVVVVSGGKYHRPKGSKYFRGPTRINRRRRKYRRNPDRSLPGIKSLFSAKILTRVLSMGGGVLGGAFLIRFLLTGMIPGLNMQIIPASFLAPLSKARPVFGIAQVIAGVYLQKKRSPIAKDIGIGLTAIGGYDLLTQLLSLVGVTSLPTLAGMNVSAYGGMNVQSSFLGMNTQPGGSQIILQGENVPSMDDLYSV